MDDTNLNVYDKDLKGKSFLFFTFILYSFCALIFNWDLFKDNEIHPIRGGLNAIIATTESIVERKTFVIDESPFVVTLDKMKVGEHFYSDKAPGFSIILVPVYLFLYKCGLVLAEQKFISITLLTIFSVVIPGVLCLYFFPKIATLFYANSSLKQIRITRNLLAFGTIMISFSGLLNYHLMATLLVMIVVYIVRLNVDKNMTVGQGLIIGVLLGSLFTFDIPTGGIFILIVGLFAFFTNQYKIIFWIAIGAIGPILAYEIINYLISGKLLPPFFYRQEFHQFEGSRHTALSLSGERGTDIFFNFKRFYTIYRNFMGSVGLFSLSPILILAILGHIKHLKGSFKRDKSIYKRFEFYLTLGVILQILFYNCIVPSATGSVYGVRHILPVIPYLMLGFIPFLEQFSMKKIYRIIILISIIFSLGGAFRHKEDGQHIVGWRQLVPAYSFVHSISLLTRYGK